MIKPLYIGTGDSTNKDPYLAGKAAALSALASLSKEKPTISYVFYAGYKDPKKLSKGLKEILGDSEFVGGSADVVFYNDRIIHKGVVIASIYSDYLTVGVASIDNVSKNSFESARKVILDALSKIQLKQYNYPGLFFSRVRKESLKWVIKIPGHFVFAFCKGFQLPHHPDETQIINGITKEIGSNTPIWGGSLLWSADKIFNNEKYKIYTLHSGKVMEDGLAIVFNLSGLLYANSLAHGAIPTSKFGTITKVSQNGYVVDEISGEPVIEWYRHQLGIPRGRFENNSMKLTQRWPLGFPDQSGNFVIRGGGVVTGSSIAYTAPVKENSPVCIMDASIQNISKVPDELKQDIENNFQPALCLAGICMSRRIVLSDLGLAREIKKIRKNFGDVPFIGYSGGGEIGAKPGMPANFSHLTSNIFLFYSKFLHEMRF